MNSIGVGVIGLDHWYNALPFVDLAEGGPGFEVVGVAHHDEARGREVVQRTSNGYLTTDATELLDDPEIRLVATFTTVDENARWCVAAANRGKHVLAGKPLGMTTAEARTVVDAASANDVVVFPFECYGRITPLYRTMKRWIDEGRIGTVLAIDCAHDAALPITWHDDHTPGWWTRAERTPGGGWIDHAIYQIDVMRYLTSGDVASIRGETATLRHVTLPFEDYGHAVIEFDGGVRATSKAHWLLPHGTFRRVVEIVGSDGMILFDSVSDTVRVRGDFGSEVNADAVTPHRKASRDLPPIAAPEGSARTGWSTFQASVPGQQTLLAHVGDVIAGREAPAADARDGHANLEAALAFYLEAVPR